MAITIAKTDCDFLHRVVKFCERIDNYVYVLGLDPVDVEDFKNDNELLSYVINNRDKYKTLADSFTAYKICCLRIKFSEIEYSCKCSKNYTDNMGEYLCISVPSEFEKFQLDAPVMGNEPVDRKLHIRVWENEELTF